MHACRMQRRDCFMSIVMFKAINGLAPADFSNEIAMQNEISESQTRSLLILNMFHKLILKA